jgi:hypothetical protein
MSRWLLSFVWLAAGFLGAQPPADHLFFSDLDEKQLKKRDAEWADFAAKNTPSEDQLLAWFRVRVLLHMEPGVPLSNSGRSEIQTIANKAKQGFPDSFAAAYCSLLLERKPCITESLPGAKTPFQETLLKWEQAKCEAYGSGSASPGFVLSLLGSERNEYYRNLLESLPYQSYVFVNGHEDAVALYTINITAGNGKSLAAVSMEALLDDFFRNKFLSMSFGHPAATPDPSAALSKALNKKPGEVAVSMTIPFEQYQSDINRLYVRGLVLTGKPEADINAKTWKYMRKDHIKKANRLSANYLPMLLTAEKEPGATSYVKPQEIKDKIKELQ